MKKEQTDSFVSAREQIKKYVRWRSICEGTTSTYIKTTNDDNPDLTELDLSRIKKGIEETEKALNDFKKELND